MKPINSLYIEIGSKIKSFRKHKGITQKELSNKVSITRPSIVHIEKGYQRLTLERLYKISNALSVSIHDILPPKGIKNE